MKTDFFLIICLLCLLTFPGCEKEEEKEEPIPKFNGSCNGEVLRSSPYFGITNEICLNCFNIGIWGTCRLTFEDDKYYYLKINAILTHQITIWDNYFKYNEQPETIIFWKKELNIEEKGTFKYDIHLYYSDVYSKDYYANITFYPENKEHYSYSISDYYYTGLNFPYLVIIEDSMKFCTEYEFDTLSSQYVCIKDTIPNKIEIGVWLSFSRRCWESFVE